MSHIIGAEKDMGVPVMVLEYLHLH